MKHLSIILFLLIIVINIADAQNKHSFHIGTGLSLTSRFLTYPNNDFSETEKQELEGLEVPKPSYSLDIGYEWIKPKGSSFLVGLGYRHTRFGTKIYTVPETAINTTPQYGLKKKVVMQNQYFAFFEYSNKKISLLSKLYPFFKVGLIYNKAYKIYEPIYDNNRKKRMIGVTSSEAFTRHKTDINLGVGFNYFIKFKNKTSLVLKPNCSLFVHPYTVTGEYNLYLYFPQDTIGILWDFGIKLQYNFLVLK